MSFLCVHFPQAKGLVIVKRRDRVTNSGSEIIDCVRNEANKKTAFANTRVTDQ